VFGRRIGVGRKVVFGGLEIQQDRGKKDGALNRANGREKRDKDHVLFYQNHRQHHKEVRTKIDRQNRGIGKMGWEISPIPFEGHAKEKRDSPSLILSKSNQLPPIPKRRTSKTARIREAVSQDGRKNVLENLL